MELNFKNRVAGTVDTKPAEPAPTLTGDGSGTPLPPISEEPKIDSVAQPEAGKNHLLRIVLGLVSGFLFFYVVADYTSSTAARIHPGELIFSNTMIQLWTATYRLLYVVGVIFALIGLVWQGLWQFFKPSDERNFDLITSIRLDLTPAQRIWLFFIVFFSLCFLFVMLLGVRLPESVSVGQ